MTRVNRSRLRRPQTSLDYDYSALSALDGSHPWQDQMPSGYVPYSVRVLRHGKIAYFNFNLAREMGLIPPDHPNIVTSELHSALVETFSLQIINEYDQIHNRRFPKDTIKSKPYMATRYLQLQHSNKFGKTSGDGRSIWNGVVKHKGITWDVSSRGTGVTCLAPGSVEADHPLKSGSEEVGYGCGLAEVDELFSSAILSESVHRQGINTERVLAIIDLGRGVGIGVRAAPNLIRPAHLFMYLKQNDLENLRRATDFFIGRQVANNEWKFSANANDRYKLMCEHVCDAFARFAAILEREYLFVWLDWDGDNCLANAGILDYGSVRQFGMRHDQYRYDDVERFSTNLNEQRSKARLIVQTFIQLTDFLQTGRKRPLESFRNHPILHRFDQAFEEQRQLRLLEQMGFSRNQSQQLLQSHRPSVRRFERHFSYFECAKTKKPAIELPDGINHPPIYNARQFLRQAPVIFLDPEDGFPSALDYKIEAFFEAMISESAEAADQELHAHTRRRLRQLLESYIRLVRAAHYKLGPRSLLREMAMRAQTFIVENRLTGNAVEHVVWELLKQRRKKMSYHDIQAVIDVFLDQQFPASATESPIEAPTLSANRGNLLRSLVNLAHSFREDI